MEEILNKLIEQIKLDQRYLDYLEAEEKLHLPEIDQLLHQYQDKLNEYESLKVYDKYIDNQSLKDEIKEIKVEISKNPDIIDYYQKYHQLNDFLEQITKIVFGNISNQLDLSPYQL